MEDNTRHTLVLLSQQHKKPAVPYFSIFNGRKPQQYRILTFPIKQMPIRTLSLLFQQQKTPAIP